MSDEIRWEAEITETACALGDEWTGGDVHLLPGVDVSEIAKDDPDPFFVEMTIMREGKGTGKPTPKNYLASAVDDCARLAPGLQAYLGHQDPKLRGREYRIPQAKIIASKTEMQTDPASGRKIKAARAKAYVSRASQDLRTHIREGMAGPVSIDGRAVLKTRGDQVDVPKMLHLRAIDFCNPGTEGGQGRGRDRDRVRDER